MHFKTSKKLVNIFYEKFVMVTMVKKIQHFLTHLNFLAGNKCFKSLKKSIQFSKILSTAKKICNIVC